MEKDQLGHNDSSLIERMSKSEEVFWINPEYLSIEKANKETSFGLEDVKDAEARLQRFSSFIRKRFPETEPLKGIIESNLSEISVMQEYLDEIHEQPVEGKLLLKRDDLLPISGTIKARGAIYEVLKHAEMLALKHGLLETIEEDYAVFDSERFKLFFSEFHLAVGTTGNLGISVGTMGRALGFQVTVHMSVEAKSWKKMYLRSLGVEVIEHATNFSKAVEQGRYLSDMDPKSYFVDDEHSKELFLGYTVGGYRMKKQLDDLGIPVDEDHPLFVYLPCGIGGSPSGVAFGLKQIFGDHVHCFFAEPTKMPCVLIGLETGLYHNVSVEEFGLGGLTVADGLAVPRTSSLVSKIIHLYFSGGYTLQDETFKRLLWELFEKESIFLEPAAVAGIIGPYHLLNTKEGKSYIQSHGLTTKLSQVTHLAWATGGSMVPEEEKQVFLEDGKLASQFAVI